MPDRAQLEAWVTEALECSDKVYQLVEVCRTVAELAETEAKDEMDKLKLQISDLKDRLTLTQKARYDALWELEQSNRLIHEFRWAANALLAKLGTDEHPVEKAWEKEFLALELLVADETNKRIHLAHETPFTAEDLKALQNSPFKVPPELERPNPADKDL